MLTYVTYTYLLTCLLIITLIIYRNKKIINCWGKKVLVALLHYYLSIRNYYVFTVGTYILEYV